MTAFDLAALDMAGTTVDEEGLVYRVLDQSVSDAAGIPVPAQLLAQWKGTSKREAIAGLLGALDAGASEDAVDKVFARFEERLIAAYEDTPPAPFPGVPEMFQTLRAAGVKVALQTGYSAGVAAAILSGLDWTSAVDAVVTSDLVPASRPAPYLIFRAMELTGVTSVARVLTAGDTPNDLQAGTNAGAGFVVGVSSGSFTLDQLASVPHTHLLESVAQIVIALSGQLPCADECPIHWPTASANEGRSTGLSANHAYRQGFHALGCVHRCRRSPNWPGGDPWVQRDAFLLGLCWSPG